MARLEFRYARGRTWQQVVYAGVVVAFTLLAALRTVDTGAGHARWFPVVLLACLGLYAFRGQFDRRPVLVFSDEGIWFRGWSVNKPVAWGDISGVRYVPAARGEPFITLDLASAAADRHVRPMYQFRTGELEIGNEEALSLTKKYWRAARQNGGTEV